MRITINQAVISASVGREQVLLDPTTGMYFGLNEVAARFWQLVSDGQSCEGALHTLVSEFDAPESQITSDVRSLLSVLQSHGLVTVQEE